MSFLRGGFRGGFQSNIVASVVHKEAVQLVNESYAYSGVYRYLFDLYKYASTLGANSGLKSDIGKKIFEIQDRLDIKLVDVNNAGVITGLKAKDESANNALTHVGFVEIAGQKMVKLVEDRIKDLNKVPYMSQREISSLALEYCNEQTKSVMMLVEELYPSDIQQSFVSREPEALDAKVAGDVGKELAKLRK